MFINFDNHFAAYASAEGVWQPTKVLSGYLAGDWPPFEKRQTDQNRESISEAVPGRATLASPGVLAA